MDDRVVGRALECLPVYRVERRAEAHPWVREVGVRAQKNRSDVDVNLVEEPAFRRRRQLAYLATLPALEFARHYLVTAAGSFRFKHSSSIAHALAHHHGGVDPVADGV